MSRMHFVSSPDPGRRFEPLKGGSMDRTEGRAAWDGDRWVVYVLCSLQLGAGWGSLRLVWSTEAIR